MRIRPIEVIISCNPTTPPHVPSGCVRNLNSFCSKLPDHLVWAELSGCRNTSVSRSASQGRGCDWQILRGLQRVFLGGGSSQHRVAQKDLEVGGRMDQHPLIKLDNGLINPLQNGPSKSCFA